MTEIQHSRTPDEAPAGECILNRTCNGDTCGYPACHDDSANNQPVPFSPVELPATVVGHDQRIGAAVGREAGVVDVHDPLEDQLAAPALLDPLDVGPRQARIELLGRP